MTRFDVFNGDADGLCALHQLRLAAPADAVLVSGVKRDIALLGRVDAHAGDEVTVLDVSAEANHAALVALLACGVRVAYFDHHFPGDLPVHEHFVAHIDTSPGTCTSLIVDRHIGGLHPLWAIVGAYGDNLVDAARRRAAPLGLGDDALRRLRELGEDLTYNGYADCEDDLIAHPAGLYRELRAHADPFTFIAQSPLMRRLGEQKRADLAMAEAQQPDLALPGATMYILPDEAWARRVRGMFANRLAERFADLAHAVLTTDGGGGFSVSVRAPRAAPDGADSVCRPFPSGGGRVAAAGINHLARDALPRFVRAMDEAFGGAGRRSSTTVGAPS